MALHAVLMGEENVSVHNAERFKDMKVHNKPAVRAVVATPVVHVGVTLNAVSYKITLPYNRTKFMTAFGGKRLFSSFCEFPCNLITKQ